MHAHADGVRTAAVCYMPEGSKWQLAWGVPCMQSRPHLLISEAINPRVSMDML